MRTFGSRVRVFIVIFKLLIVHNSVFSQQKGLSGYYGFEVGHETFISGVLPKIGLIRYMNLRNDSLYNQKRSTITAYAGADITLGVLYAAWFASNAYAGVKLGHLTLDNSIAYFAGLHSEGKHIDYGTYNPKLGVKIGKIWFKSGPSFKIGKSFYLDNSTYFKIGYFNYNFELQIQEEAFKIKKRHEPVFYEN